MNPVSSPLSFTTTEVREHLLAFGGIIPNTDVLKLCDAYDAREAEARACRAQVFDMSERLSRMQRELDLLHRARS